MKRLFLVLSIAVLGLQIAHASTRADVKVLEASDTIRYRINNLVRSYFIYYRFPKKIQLKAALQQDLVRIGESMREIAVTTKDPKTLNILAYFSYQKTRIEEILGRKPSQEDLKELLEMSEGFVEGVDLISRRHHYRFDEEEKMFMLTRSLRHRLEEVVKYYLAQELISADPNLNKKMQWQADRVDRELQRIELYPYTDKKLLAVRSTLNRIWRMIQPRLAGAQWNPLPLFVSLSTERMESLLDVLGTYHSRNQ